jgi:hypothetical protein
MMAEPNLIELFKARGDFINYMITVGINPFVGQSLFTALMTDQPDEVIFDIIKKIKTCYYFAFMDNILLYNEKTNDYSTNRGVVVPVKAIANKLGPVALSYPPRCLVYHTLNLKYNEACDKKIQVSGLSSMDGFVNVDDMLPFEIINMD